MDIINQRPIDSLSNDNTLFCTEQCNNHCLMCCQPPQRQDDIDLLFQENVNRIKKAPKDISIIGITGGEPTLLGVKLIELIKLIRIELPNTDIHVLSNGRNFFDDSFARNVVEAGGERLIIGIPLHSDYAKDHDLIAGCKGAYNETVQGLYNLASYGACIELRIVVNRQNYQRLFEMSEFIRKNLPFVTWVAFMGMEYIGFAIKNARRIWIEPLDYIEPLQKAIHNMAEWNCRASIYNIPLCLLPIDLHPFAEQSISDWKQLFLKECDECALKDKCCGSFQTSIKPYVGLHPIRAKED